MNRFVIFALIMGISVIDCLKAQTTFPKIGGWKIVDPIANYNTETLWEYIDGAADYYLKYGFTDAEIAEYSLSEDVYIKADVYHHQSPLEAFGIYSFERRAESKFLDLGNEGYIEPAALNFYSGSCYVKIYSNQPNEKTIAAINKIAVKLSEHLSYQAEKPALLELLPDYERVIHSEKYIPVDFLGYNFLKSVLVSDYQNSDLHYQMFLIKSDSTEASLSILKKYLEFVGYQKEPEEETIFGIDDTFNGYIPIMVSGNYLLGIIGLDDRDFAEEYLEQFMEYVLKLK